MITTLSLSQVFNNYLEIDFLLTNPINILSHITQDIEHVRGVGIACMVEAMKNCVSRNLSGLVVKPLRSAVGFYLRVGFSKSQSGSSAESAASISYSASRRAVQELLSIPRTPDTDGAICGLALKILHDHPFAQTKDTINLKFKHNATTIDVLFSKEGDLLHFTDGKIDRTLVSQEFFPE